MSSYALPLPFDVEPEPATPQRCTEPGEWGLDFLPATVEPSQRYDIVMPDGVKPYYDGTIAFDVWREAWGRRTKAMINR